MCIYIYPRQFTRVVLIYSSCSNIHIHPISLKTQPAHTRIYTRSDYRTIFIKKKNKTPRTCLHYTRHPPYIYTRVHSRGYYTPANRSNSEFPLSLSPTHAYILSPRSTVILGYTTTTTLREFQQFSVSLSLSPFIRTSRAAAAAAALHDLPLCNAPHLRRMIFVGETRSFLMAFCCCCCEPFFQSYGVCSGRETLGCKREMCVRRCLSLYYTCTLLVRRVFVNLISIVIYFFLSLYNIVIRLIN